MADQSITSSDKLKGYVSKATDFLSHLGEGKEDKAKREAAEAAGKQNKAEQDAALGKGSDTDLSGLNTGIVSRGGYMPKRHFGGPVLHSGPHDLEKGEHVLTKKQTEQYKSAGHVLGGATVGHDGAKHEVHGMHIKKAQTGGFHVQHHDQHGMPHADNGHVVSNMDALHDHIEEHMGQPNPGEQMEEEAGYGEKEA